METVEEAASYLVVFSKAEAIISGGNEKAYIHTVIEQDPSTRNPQTICVGECGIPSSDQSSLLLSMVRLRSKHEYTTV